MKDYSQYFKGPNLQEAKKRSHHQVDHLNDAFEIPVDMKEQEAIAAVLTAMDEEIRNLEIERDKIIQIREGAMDDLLTGRVRLT